MHADEVHIDSELVRRLVRVQFPRWADLPLKPVPSAGTDNALYRLGDAMCVRLPRIHWASGNIDRECAWLPRLAPELPFAVPVPLAKGAPGQGFPFPWSIGPWLAGRNPALNDAIDFEQLAGDLATFVAALHAIDATGGPLAERGLPLAMRDQPTRAAIKALGEGIDSAAVTSMWDEALGIPAWRGAPVWLHADLSPGNILCAEGKLSAVIDFGCMGVGDPACDLIVAWNLLPARVRETFRHMLAVDDATWARGRGWALSIALIQLPYYKDRNSALAANARHVIGELTASRLR